MPEFKKSRGYKMNGHTLPGPNQKASPMKEPITAAILGSLAATIGGKIIGGAMVAGQKKIDKEKALAAKKAEAYKGLNIQA